MSLMSAQVSESLAKSFRIDSEALRNLDALVKDKWPDAMRRNPKALEYEVIRKDALTYRTNDVEDILREDNDRATRIQSISMRLSDPNFVEMHVLFSENGIDINANAADRAQLLLFVTDFKNVVRDQMKRRGTHKWPILWRLPAIPLVCGLFVLVFAVVSNSFWSHARDEYQEAMDQYYQRQVQADSEYRTNALAVKASGTLDEEIDLLIADSIYYHTERPDEPEWPDSPWYLTKTALGIGLLISALLGYFAMTFFFPRREAFFLIGKFVEVQRKRDKVRSNLFWIVGVGFVVAVVAGVVVGLVLP